MILNVIQSQGTPPAASHGAQHRRAAGVQPQVVHVEVPRSEGCGVANAAHAEARHHRHVQIDEVVGEVVGAEAPLLPSAGVADIDPGLVVGERMGRDEEEELAGHEGVDIAVGLADVVENLLDIEGGIVLLRVAFEPGETCSPMQPSRSGWHADLSRHGPRIDQWHGKKHANRLRVFSLTIFDHLADLIYIVSTLAQRS